MGSHPWCKHARFKSKDQSPYGSLAKWRYTARKERDHSARIRLADSQRACRVCSFFREDLLERAKESLVDRREK